jgi:hypothetical protein
MAKISTFDAIRIIPRNNDFLNRKLGARGEIFYDQQSNSLRLYDGKIIGGISLAKSDLTNISNSIFLAKATAAGVVSGSGGTVSNSFTTIAVAGQSNIIATSATDILTLVAGDNITINTNAGSDTITISSTSSSGASMLDDLADVVISGTPVNGQVLKYNGTNWVNDTDATSEGGASSNSFSTISVSGQSSVVADSATDTLTVIAGTGITVTTNATNDSITINNSVSSLGNLTDVATASLTVDRFYLPAITMLTVTNSGASAYRFDQYGATNNPTIYAINGTTIAFNLAATGHPFLIQTPGGVNYNTGLTHVSAAGVVSTGSSAQGKDSGTLYWKIPTDISGGYRYQCSAHAPMVGSISIKTFATL